MWQTRQVLRRPSSSVRYLQRLQCLLRSFRRRPSTDDDVVSLCQRAGYCSWLMNAWCLVYIITYVPYWPRCFYSILALVLLYLITLVLLYLITVIVVVLLSCIIVCYVGILCDWKLCRCLCDYCNAVRPCYIVNNLGLRSVLAHAIDRCLRSAFSPNTQMQFISNGPISDGQISNPNST